ncbi:oxysterol-binding protein-related protein 1C-like isoform X2 [Trifolium pratense]|uniref:oxysterol-binding protein-related protein 1C-like isoform X2 n=1 Tax=Trifolium pratense TaxID=57577 RepID=UPI001E693C3F|nr:oxysterol-binding protein-related protein 1C-like isoform X2 [Trifolium pratense]
MVVRINDLVGNGISGILQKWVNYGRGWRHRWFLLQDGVLSYYKIHGPDKVVINPETEKGFKVIGDESMLIISSNRNSLHSQHQLKAFCEIQLKINLQLLATCFPQSNQSVFCLPHSKRIADGSVPLLVCAIMLSYVSSY